MVAKRATSMIPVLVVAISLCGLHTPSADADLVISIEGECPGQVVLYWEGAAPNRWAAVLGSWRLGEYWNPAPPCDGTKLDLLPPTVVSHVRSGPDGTGSVGGFVPGRFCGAYLQMVVADGRPCQTSNVVQIE